MLAGGIGGTTGDMLMHSLDTVKTRQQGDPHMPSKYTSMGLTYRTIWRQEGLVRGLYGGVTPAFLGSFTGTMTFFGAYEYSKRAMIDWGVNPSVAYFTSGTTLYILCAASHTNKPIRLLRRSRRIPLVCPFRGAQDQVAITGPTQQPLLLQWLQLQWHVGCLQNYHSC
jgi:hypothetical protein